MDPPDTEQIQTETSEMDQQLLASRNQLKESHERLIGVSQYCESEYFNNKEDSYNAKAQLEKTKQYTTQSLASVAYQINTLATTFLSILQMQTAQLNMLETAINQVGQKVDLYQEKVARRDIGKLANKRSMNRSICVRKVYPNEIKNNVDYSARPHRYIRRGIDFSTLDLTGSGSYSKMKNSRLMQVSGAGSQSNRLNNHSGPTVPMPMSLVNQGQNQLSLHQLQHGQMQQHVRQASSSHSGGSSNNMNLSNHSYAGLGAQMISGYGTLGKNVKVPDVGPGIGLGSGPGPGSGQGPGPSLGQINGHSLTNSTRSNNPSQNSAPNMVNGQQNNGPSRLKPLSDGIPSPPGPAPPPPPMMANKPVEVVQVNPGVVYPPQMFSEEMPVMTQTSLVTDGVELSDHTEIFNPTSKTPWQPQTYLEKVKVIYDYSPDQEDELELAEGDIIYVIVKNEDGWWEGFKSENVSGLFPSNYVASDS